MCVTKEVSLTTTKKIKIAHINSAWLHKPKGHPQHWFFNSTLDCANRWTQQLDGLYPLPYFFWMWHCQHALVSTVHIPSHAIKANMCNLVNIY
jgi:hypothetical protein